MSFGGSGGGGSIASSADVIINSVTDGQSLGYDGIAMKWKNTARSAQLTENVNNVVTAGTTQNIPPVTTATINVLRLTSANCSITLPTAVAGQSLLIALTQDSTGSRGATWHGVWWQSAATPTLTTTPAKTDVFSFIAIDNVKWLGFQVGQNF